MPTNWWMLLVVGLIPLFIGFFWYGKMLFADKWMAVNGFTESDLEGANMGLIFGLSYLFSVLVGFALSGIVIHQGAIMQTMIPDVLESGSKAATLYSEVMASYGDAHRSFGHGALHGGIFTLFFVFPLIAINALFERRGWTYIMIHAGYWLICLILMGGILCRTLQYA